MKDVEGVVGHAVVAALRQIVLQGREVCSAMLVGRDHLSVEYELGRGDSTNRHGDGRKPLGPVQTAAGVKRWQPAAQMRLDAVAVELYLVNIACAGRRLR